MCSGAMLLMQTQKQAEEPRLAAGTRRMDGGFIIEKQSPKVNYYTALSPGFEGIRESYLKVERDWAGLSASDLILGLGFWKIAGASLKAPFRSRVAAIEIIQSEPVQNLLKAGADCNIAYKKFVAAHNSLKNSPTDPKCAQGYMLAQIEYVTRLHDIQAQIAHFEQSNQKGKAIINGINFALDAVTLPLLAVGVGELYAGLKMGVSEGFAWAGKAFLKNMAKGALPTLGYAGLMTAGDYYGMKDLQIAASQFDKDAGKSLSLFKNALKKMSTEARNLGMAELKDKTIDLYFKAEHLSDDYKSGDISKAELAGKFAQYFAIGMFMTGIFACGKAMRKPVMGAGGEVKPEVPKEIKTAAKSGKKVDVTHAQKNVIKSLLKAYPGLTPENASSMVKFIRSSDKPIVFAGCNGDFLDMLGSKKGIFLNPFFSAEEIASYSNEIVKLGGENFKVREELDANKVLRWVAEFKLWGENKEAIFYKGYSSDLFTKIKPQEITGGISYYMTPHLSPEGVLFTPEILSCIPKGGYVASKYNFDNALSKKLLGFEAIGDLGTNGVTTAHFGEYYLLKKITQINITPERIDFMNSLISYKSLLNYVNRLKSTNPLEQVDLDLTFQFSELRRNYGLLSIADQKLIAPDLKRLLTSFPKKSDFPALAESYDKIVSFFSQTAKEYFPEFFEPPTKKN
jgi:hypothetical protein